MRLYVAVVALLVAGADVALAQTAGARAGAATAKPSAGAGPVIVVDTIKGSFEFETYPSEAPKTVEHILALVRRNFYNGQRVHRVVPGFVMQFGDPLTRDMRKQADWGGGGSNKPVGVLETSPKHTHVVGAVALAHLSGNPGSGDSQMYVVLAPQPQLNKDFTVFGKVISGMDVVQKLRVPDIIKRVSVKGETKPRS